MGKSSEQTVGYHYRVAYHALLTFTCDAFLEFRGAEKTAWNGRAQQWNDSGEAVYKRGSNRPIYFNNLPATGEVTSSQEIYIAAPNLFGGEKDQGGILGPVDIMFGEADQLPNPYLQSVFGNQTAAWRGFTTLVFKGGRFGAMNPMPQKPSYKLRKILKGWDEPGCWYPEKAAVPFGGELAPAYTLTFLRTPDSPHSFSQPSDVDSWDPNPAAYETVSASIAAPIIWPTGEVGDTSLLWIVVDAPAGVGRAFNLDIKVNYDDSGKIIGSSGLFAGEATPPAPVPTYPGAQGIRVVVPKTAGPFHGWIALACVDGLNIETGEPYGSATAHRAIVSSAEVIESAYAMNPAHTLYYVRTGSEKGRESRANINDASLTAAADRLYAEGFGVCWEYDPARDTPDSFEERICRIIGGSFERSLTDGEWYLDLARGDYDIESLPIIGDDDILEFKESPTTLDRAVNSMAVKYFDVERKESVITPAVRALGLIRRFGEIHETLDFPEIPTGGLALRVADRELRARVTPTRTFELVTSPRMKGLRRNQYFRLQSPKRGIADMVCIVGSKEHGTLASGAIRWKVSQDVYALPDTSYIEIEEGVDTSPPTTPVPIEHARVFEVPYIDLVATLPRSELEQLSDDAGYLFGVAASPGVGLDYLMCVEPNGGDYRLAGTGEWCPTTTTTGAQPAEIGPTVVPLASIAGIENIAIGSVVLWEDEWCRLDALDAEAMEATLGRGCADTVPHDHAAGSRLWFFVEAAADTTEYTDGEQINVKLLPSTSSQQLPLESATAMPLEFDGRQARPYPPAGLLVNGEEAPDTFVGEITLTWVHRDRVLQADQLVDQATAGIGPEAGTTYNVRWYLNAVLVHSETGITGTTASYTPADGGLLRIELESERDGLASWQMHVRQFVIGTALTTEAGDLITTEDGQPIFME